MASPNQQNLSNHTRWDPLFHFIAAPVSLLTLIGAIVHAVRHFSIWNVWVVVAVATAVVMLGRLRGYSLMVQDRVIRLEERLRLMGLCGEPLRSRIHELSIRQLTALRFASDAEAAALAERALTSNLTNKQIKQAIQVWRPDEHRV